MSRGCSLNDSWAANVTLEDLGNTGEFLGAIAVLVSLLYLAMQIRQNTVTVRAGTSAAISDSLARVTEIVGADPRTARVYYEWPSRRPQPLPRGETPVQSPIRDLYAPRRKRLLPTIPWVRRFRALADYRPDFFADYEDAWRKERLGCIPKHIQRSVCCVRRPRPPGGRPQPIRRLTSSLKCNKS